MKMCSAFRFIDINVKQTQFHMKGFAPKLVLKQGNLETPNWVKGREIFWLSMHEIGKFIEGLVLELFLAELWENGNIGGLPFVRIDQLEWPLNDLKGFTKICKSTERDGP